MNFVSASFKTLLVLALTVFQTLPGYGQTGTISGEIQDIQALPDGNFRIFISHEGKKSEFLISDTTFVQSILEAQNLKPGDQILLNAAGEFLDQSFFTSEFQRAFPGKKMTPDAAQLAKQAASQQKMMNAVEQAKLAAEHAKRPPERPDAGIPPPPPASPPKGPDGRPPEAQLPGGQKTEEPQGSSPKKSAEENTDPRNFDQSINANPSPLNEAAPEAPPPPPKAETKRQGPSFKPDIEVKQILHVEKSAEAVKLELVGDEGNVEDRVVAPEQQLLRMSTPKSLEKKMTVQLRAVEDGKSRVVESITVL